MVGVLIQTCCVVFEGPRAYLGLEARLLSYDTEGDPEVKHSRIIVGVSISQRQRGNLPHIQTATTSAFERSDSKIEQKANLRVLVDELEM